MSDPPERTAGTEKRKTGSGPVLGGDRRARLHRLPEGLARGKPGKGPAGTFRPRPVPHLPPGTLCRRSGQCLLDHLPGSPERAHCRPRRAFTRSPLFIRILFSTGLSGHSGVRRRYGVSAGSPNRISQKRKNNMREKSLHPTPGEYLRVNHKGGPFVPRLLIVGRVRSMMVDEFRPAIDPYSGPCNESMRDDWPKIKRSDPYVRSQTPRFSGDFSGRETRPAPPETSGSSRLSGHGTGKTPRAEFSFRSFLA